MDTERTGCVVVLEEGAPWPAGAFSSANPDEVVVVHESPGESDRELFSRVMQRCSARTHAGVSLRTAMLSCSGAVGDGRLESRTRLACGLLSRLLSTPESRLVLVTDDRRGPTTNSLLGLAGVLVEFLNGTGVSVDVRAERQPSRPVPLALLGRGAASVDPPLRKRVSGRAPAMVAAALGQAAANH
jgi:hypothetical protein